MRFSSPVSTLAVLSSSFAPAIAQRSNGWIGENFKTLVTFGDSYTDETRLGYFMNHNGSAPPVGYQQPVGLNTASGGLSWARYASIYTGTTLYNYAVGGAVCSNDITPRWFSNINAPFPSITSYELPAYLADSTYTTPNGTKFFTGTPDSTVYAIWIGTNDLGNNAFLTDSQVPGKTLKDYIDCVYNTIDALYESGGRYFVLMNLAPLQLLPQYATPENGGLNATQFWQDKKGNLTEISWRMYENVVTVNEVFLYRTIYEAAIEKRWAGGHVATFDVNALLTSVWLEPGKYLNGTGTLDVKGVAKKCDVQGKNCVLDPNPDRFLWFDELHPSEQASRVVAREFEKVVGIGSQFATYWE